MKTFDDERKKLLDWYISRIQEANKLPWDSREYGLDGSPQDQQKLIEDREYRRRLRALYAEHGKVANF